jgi:four helix bundle protein
MEKYLTLNDIKAYIIAYKLSNYVWEIVIQWDWFAKKTLGGQFVESTDSISANIAEGFGRYFKKDKVNFYRYSKGSALEATDWNNKAIKRKLLTEDQYNHINNELQKLPREINNLIKFTNEKLKI